MANNNYFVNKVISSKNIFSFDNEWNLKTISIFAFLMVIPNLLGMININTGLGFNIHIFQIAIFLAAILYGPIGGLITGITGSVFSAVIMHNPYLIIGNAILGLCVGIFIKYGVNIILSVLFAFAIQIPWLIATDYYLMHMPLPVIGMLLIALAISNTIWATVANLSAKAARNFIA